MSGVGFFELVILFMIGLVVLGPKRLPQVANQLGTWIGQARRMTRAMKRQLEDELNVGEQFDDLRNLGDELRDDLTIGPAAAHVPRDDDSYSPLHDEHEAGDDDVPDKAADSSGVSGKSEPDSSDKEGAGNEPEEKQA